MPGGGDPLDGFADVRDSRLLGVGGGADEVMSRVRSMMDGFTD
jgi:hypothetical protein